MLVNPLPLRALPGRKTDVTDVTDSEGLADLLRHGLVQPSFSPPAPMRAGRALTRQRKALLYQRTQAVTRIAKRLEGANSQVAAVATSLLGKSARDMLPTLLEGEADPAVLADLARGRRRAKLPHLRQALRGRLRPFQRVILRQLLAHSAFLDASLAQVEAARDERLRPDAQAVDRLQPSPGVKAPTAAPLVAERAVARTCFPSAG